MSAIDKIDFSQYDKDELLKLLRKVQHELSQKKLALREARNRLQYARKKIKTLRETVDFQRKRIVDFYKSQDKITDSAVHYIRKLKLNITKCLILK
jgi:hypothetical protein